MSDLRLYLPGPNSEMIFGFVAAGSIVEGVDALTQEVTVELLSDPGIPDGRGAGLSRALSAVDARDESAAQKEVEAAVGVVKAAILKRQEGSPPRPADEKLRTLRVLEVKAGSAGWVVSLELTTARGRTSVFEAGVPL